MTTPYSFKAGRKTQDLFKKSFFPLEEVDLDVLVTSPNDLRLLVNCIRDNTQGNLFMNLEQSYSLKNKGLEISASASNVPDIFGHSAKIAYSPLHYPGLTTTLGATLLGKESELDLNVEYLTQQRTLNGYLKTSLNSVSHLAGLNLTQLYRNFIFGSYYESKFSLNEKPRTTKAGAALEFQQTDFSVTFYTQYELMAPNDALKQVMHLVGVSYFQTLSPKLDVGFNVSSDLNNEFPPVNFGFGALYRADESTILRGKLDLDKSFGISVEHQFNKNIGVILGFDLTALAC
eukprot:TRINITY_DN4141_c0_g3_i1.p1 TRINITY_DN4141_c0_g3~~TRINITY_DN4141_c0_g3_i1.p1  ORF type:complete len:289 (-),score=40.00 TRINITY_DN4141_c0_g3_i1:7-873(-)